MPIEVKKEMLQRKYSWKVGEGDDPYRQIDATLFNRHEGYEVVYMIQKVDG